MIHRVSTFEESVLMLHELQRQYAGTLFENKLPAFHHRIHRKRSLDFSQHLRYWREYFATDKHNQPVLVHLLDISLETDLNIK